jgi:hypothetical protein
VMCLDIAMSSAPFYPSDQSKRIPDREMRLCTSNTNHLHKRPAAGGSEGVAVGAMGLTHRLPRQGL